MSKMPSFFWWFISQQVCKQWGKILLSFASFSHQLERFIFASSLFRALTRT